MNNRVNNVKIKRYKHMLKYFRPNIKTSNKTKIKQISHDPCVVSLHIFLKFETKVSQNTSCSLTDFSPTP